MRAVLGLTSSLDTESKRSQYGGPAPASSSSQTKPTPPKRAARNSLAASTCACTATTLAARLRASRRPFSCLSWLAKPTLRHSRVSLSALPLWRRFSQRAGKTPRWKSWLSCLAESTG